MDKGALSVIGFPFGLVLDRYRCSARIITAVVRPIEPIPVPRAAGSVYIMP
jgi:hypothetical protein